MKQPTDTEMLDWADRHLIDLFWSLGVTIKPGVYEKGPLTICYDHNGSQRASHGKDLRDCITKAMREEDGQ